MLVNFDLVFGNRIADAHRRQAAIFLVIFVVFAFLIESQEAVKAHNLTGSTEIQLARASLGSDFDSGALKQGAFHLAGQSAGPDQLIKPGLIGIHVALDVFGQAAEVGRADGLVSLLRIFGFGGIAARHVRHIFRAEFIADDLAGGSDGFGGHIDAIGSHIGDETDGLAAKINAFVEFLRHTHGVGGGKTELARGFLLQGGRGERRIGVALCRFGLDRTDRVFGGIKRGAKGLGFSLCANVKAGDFLAVRAHKAGGESSAVFGFKLGDNRPIFAFDEFFDL